MRAPQLIRVYLNNGTQEALVPIASIVDVRDGPEGTATITVDREKGQRTYVVYSTRAAVLESIGVLDFGPPRAVAQEAPGVQIATSNRGFLK